MSVYMSSHLIQYNIGKYQIASTIRHDIITTCIKNIKKIHGILQQRKMHFKAELYYADVGGRLYLPVRQIHVHVVGRTGGPWGDQ